MAGLFASYSALAGFGLGEAFLILFVFLVLILILISIVVNRHSQFDHFSTWPGFLYLPAVVASQAHFTRQKIFERITQKMRIHKIILLKLANVVVALWIINTKNWDHIKSFFKTGRRRALAVGIAVCGTGVSRHLMAPPKSTGVGHSNFSTCLAPSVLNIRSLSICSPCL